MDAGTKARFWTKVDKKGPIVVKRLGRCWVWTAGRFRSGYGGFWLSGRSAKAHRAAYQLLVTRVPDDTCLLHRCDNRLCVRPSHMFLGTRADNNADASAKGRARCGTEERHGAAKLTRKKVVKLRAEYAVGDVTQHELAIKYGVGQVAIWKVIHRRTWAHV